ncbi:MAG: hypothetical protein AAFV53_30100 [Myxococcota bacterium]
MNAPLTHLIREARHLAAAERLATDRGHSAVAGQLGECRRLVLARILRTFPEQARLKAGQVSVVGEGEVGLLSTVEATQLGVLSHG